MSNNKLPARPPRRVVHHHKVTYKRVDRARDALEAALIRTAVGVGDAVFPGLGIAKTFDEAYQKAKAPKPPPPPKIGPKVINLKKGPEGAYE